MVSAITRQYSVVNYIESKCNVICNAIQILQCNVWSSLYEATVYCNSAVL